ASIDMFASWLLFSISIVVCHCGSCEDWREEDSSNHECRSCRDMTIDDLTNCPEGGTCDEKEPLRARVLTASDPCTCQTLRCANKGWRLAVNQTLVDKVRCKEGQWFTTGGLIASSFVCAMPTDPGIPATPKPLICPKLEPADIGKCNAETASTKCFALPVIEEPTIKCPNSPPNNLYYETATDDERTTELKCDAASMKWHNADGNPVDVVRVACQDKR
ncbi:hypothetical protein PENTCL1PPCAC_9723, partial [Pristionchus entomophagus]